MEKEMEKQKLSLEEFKEKYITPFGRLGYIFDDRGYIVWREGTGNNIELLHIGVFEKRKGYGRQLVKEMLERLEENPPYFSVFGFTRTSNKIAHSFYKTLGFNLVPLAGLYKDGSAVMFWQDYEILKNVHLK